MDEIDNILEDDFEEEVSPEKEPEEEEAPEPAAEQPKESLEAKKARLERELKRTNRALGKDEPAPLQTKNSDELDEAQLDYLDVKGVTDEDEIEVIWSVVKKTGMSVRDALKDDYVSAKLEKIREQKAVKDATPGTNRRAGGGTPDSLAAAVARFEATQELPTDFALRSQVVEALVSRTATNKPSWK